MLGSWLFFLACLLQLVNSTELKICIQRADCQTRASFRPHLSSPVLQPPMCHNLPNRHFKAIYQRSHHQKGSLCIMLPHCASPPLSHHMDFPFWFVFMCFPNKNSPMPLRSLLLTPGWLPTCSNSCIIKMKTTPGNWQALLIEN